MALRVLVPPGATPLSVTEAKAHLRVTSSQEDPVIAGMIREAVAAVDGPEGTLGRCLIEQTLELSADEWPYRCGWISLPCPPLIGVTSISYVDQDGAEQVVDPATYQVTGVGAQGRVELAYNQTWPSARRQPEAIRIVYEAGYGPDHNYVPESIRAGLKMLIADLFERRGSYIEGGCFPTSAADRQLAPYKVYRP